MFDNKLEPYNLVNPPQNYDQLPKLQFSEKLPELQFPQTPTLSFIQQFQEQQKYNVPVTNKNYVFNNRNEFVTTFKPIIEQELQNQGIDPKYSNYLIAQMALESSWGKKPSGKNNFAGLKGKGTKVKTHEYYNGVKTSVVDSFMDFNTLNDFAKYYVTRLKNKFKAFDSGDFVTNLHKNKYFTTPLSQYKNLFNLILKKVKSYD